jgi:hypothetical protein
MFTIYCGGGSFRDLHSQVMPASKPLCGGREISANMIIRIARD